ncbi:MAG: hypothetical protein HC779_03300 [Phyllobacteriaceae bacterium]|nr:hypothetical protein [Phyllobacteriaceae bacterium]
MRPRRDSHALPDFRLIDEFVLTGNKPLKINRYNAVDAAEPGLCAHSAASLSPNFQLLNHVPTTIGTVLRLWQRFCGVIMDEQAGKVCWGITLRAMLGFAFVVGIGFAFGIA